MPSSEIKLNTEIKPLSKSTLPHFERPLLDIVLVEEGEHDWNKGIYVTSSEDPDKEIVSVLLKQTLEFEFEFG